MSTAKATYIGISNIIEAFERKAQTPYFAVFEGTLIHEKNLENDFEIAVMKLENCLNDLKKSNNDHIFIIKLYDDVPKDFRDKTAIVMYCQIPCLNSYPALIPQQSATDSLILQKLTELESKINAIEGEEIEEEKEDKSTLGQIGKLLENPVVSGVMSLIVSGIAKSLNLPTEQPVTSLAGIDQETELHDALNKLFSKGVTLQHIKKLSDLPKEKITMLLSML